LTPASIRSRVFFVGPYAGAQAGVLSFIVSLRWGPPGASAVSE
jgi:hypothetical protein